MAMPRTPITINIVEEAPDIWALVQPNSFSNSGNSTPKVKNRPRYIICVTMQAPTM
jgi:hypothetical protein